MQRTLIVDCSVAPLLQEKGNGPRARESYARDIAALDRLEAETWDMTARQIELAFGTLAAVDVAAEDRARVLCLQVVPSFTRGAVRTAFRRAMEHVRSNRGNDSEGEGWKLFFYVHACSCSGPKARPRSVKKSFNVASPCPVLASGSICCKRHALLVSVIHPPNLQSQTWRDGLTVQQPLPTWRNCQLPPSAY